MRLLSPYRLRVGSPAVPVVALGEFSTYLILGATPTLIGIREASFSKVYRGIIKIREPECILPNLPSENQWFFTLFEFCSIIHGHAQASVRSLIMKSRHLSLKSQGCLLPILILFTICRNTSADTKVGWYFQNCSNDGSAVLSANINLAAAIWQSTTYWIPGSKFQKAMSAYLGPESSDNHGLRWTYLEVIQGHTCLMIWYGILLLADLNWSFQINSSNYKRASDGACRSIVTKLMTSIYTATLPIGKMTPVRQAM